MSFKEDYQSKRSGYPKLPLRDLLKIIKSYRKKRSLWFIIKWIFLLRPSPPAGKIHIPGILRLFGQWNKEALHLYRIHIGLRKELGSTRASLATLEIYRAYNRYLEEYNRRHLGSRWQRIKMLFRKKNGSVTPTVQPFDPNSDSLESIEKKKDVSFRVKRRAQRWEELRRQKQTEMGSIQLSAYPELIWRSVYQREEYFFGKRPNELLIDQLPFLEPGLAYFPGAGEGRDAVYAARLGWRVLAADLCEQAAQKAIQLAQEYKVSIDFNVKDIRTFFPDSNFDLIVVSWTNLPPGEREHFHNRLLSSLKPGGYLLFTGALKASPGLSSLGLGDSTLSTRVIFDDFLGEKILFFKKRTGKICLGGQVEDDVQYLQMVVKKV
jgi:SAM-dependent methyltransferase